VVVRGDHGSSMIDYFGILQEVLEVVYLGGNKRVLVFKCEWFKVDNANGLQVDKESRITSVNTSRKWYVDQPYILASQAKQVFYVPDLKLGRNWYVVESNDPRTLYNVSVEKVAERHRVEEIYQKEEPHLNMPVDSNLKSTILNERFCPIEHGNMNASGIQNNKETVNPSRQKLNKKKGKGVGQHADRMDTSSSLSTRKA
nr:hypothetical protein [Tanacetum cinerariifolium]